MTASFANVASNQLFQLALLVVAAVLVFLIVRYFFHIIIQILHFLMSFLWHGCIIVIVIAILFGVLHALKIF